MAEDARTPALIDTSVLLNFLAIDRVDLLARHPRHRFVVTDHVHGQTRTFTLPARPVMNAFCARGNTGAPTAGGDAQDAQENHRCA